MDKMFSFYDLAVQLVGEVPPQFEIIYFIVMVALIFCALLVIMSPLLLLKTMGRR